MPEPREELEKVLVIHEWKSGNALYQLVQKGGDGLTKHVRWRTDDGDEPTNEDWIKSCGMVAIGNHIVRLAKDLETATALLENLVLCGHSEPIKGIGYVELQVDPDDVAEARAWLRERAKG